MDVNPMESLWKLCHDLWENQSTNIAEIYKANYKYWDGEYNPENEKLKDQKKTACNVVKRIVEKKGDNALDAQFSMNVVPVLNAFADVNQLRAMHDYADVLNEEAHNVLKDNNWDSLKEKVMRRGEIGGLAPSQTTWDTETSVSGRIKLDDIEPESFRWDKSAKRPQDCTFYGYLIEQNPIVAKSQYARNADGTFNEELCKKIDEISESKSDNSKGERKGVVNYSTANGAGQAFAYDSSGIKSGKIVKLVVMFLLDDSVYAPVEGEDKDTEESKRAGMLQYPNGRMIVFALDEGKKLIFDDRPAPKGFKSLGNIDVFRPLDIGEMRGKDEIADLIPIQDRINGAYAKLRVLVGEHISTFLFPDELKGIVKEGALVANAITFIQSLSLLGPDKTPPFITNNNIEEAMRLLELIERYEMEAYRTAGINELMATGVQPKGVTSGDQLAELNESPMTSIRKLQRNFRNYVVSVGEKIVTLIQEYYTVQRLISLSNGADGAKFARFNQQGEERSVELINAEGAAVKTIKIDPKWKFRVEVTSGTDIPRSRRENAALTDKVAEVMARVTDPDYLEMYLRNIDFPNYRAVIQLVRQKQKEAAQQPFTVKTLAMHPEQMKAAAAFLESLQKAGRPEAVGQCLEMLGLSGKPGDLSDTPVQDVTSKSDVKEVAATTPGKVSKDPQTDIDGREIAGAIIDKEKEKNKQPFPAVVK